MKLITSSVMEVDCRCSSPAFSTCQLYQPALQGEYLATLSRITRFTETQSKPASWCSHSQSLQVTVLCNDGTMPRLQPPPTHTCRRSWPPTQLVPQYKQSHTTHLNCAFVAPGAAVQLQPSYQPGAPTSARAPTLGSPQKPKTPGAPTRHRPPNLAARRKTNAPLETDHELPAMTANIPPRPATRAWAAPRHARARPTRRGD